MAVLGGEDSCGEAAACQPWVPSLLRDESRLIQYPVMVIYRPGPLLHRDHPKGPASFTAPKGGWWLLPRASQPPAHQASPQSLLLGPRLPHPWTVQFCRAASAFSQGTLDTNAICGQGFTPPPTHASTTALGVLG